MKAGLLSTEFYVAVITTIAMLVANFTGIELDTQEILAVVLPVIAYVTSRTFVKVKAGGEANGTSS